jgi:hypothetical protein
MEGIGVAQELDMAETIYGPSSIMALKERLQQRVEEARQRLESVQQDIRELRVEDHGALDRKVSEIRERIDSQRTSSEGLREEASSWLQDKAEQAGEVIEKWRQKRAVRHLEARAERAEEYAITALVNAMIDADEAEMAILEAFQARLDANAAAISDAYGSARGSG